MIAETNKKKINEPLIGAHMSISGGLHLAIERGKNINCRAIQIFTRNSNRWNSKEITNEEAQKFIAVRKESGISPVFAHDIYLINLASPDDKIFEMSVKSFLEEVRRAEQLKLDFLVFHPGAHKGSGIKEGIKKISGSLKEVLRKTDGFAVKLLFETTAGQGTSIGASFEEIADLMEQTGNKERLGVCIDTCHIFAAGYDIRTAESYKETLSKFDEIIGLDYVKAFHFNDSKGDLESHLDRHEHIGKGHLGKDTFKYILNDERFYAIPKVLETPKGADMKEDIDNMDILRHLFSIT